MGPSDAPGRQRLVLMSLSAQADVSAAADVSDSPRRKLPWERRGNPLFTRRRIHAGSGGE